MSVYSFSQLQVFQQCPRKYQYKYVDQIKDKDFESSLDLLLGTCVHSSLEHLYNQINIFHILDEQEVVWYFDALWEAELEKNKWSTSIVAKWDQTANDYMRRGQQYLIKYYENHKPFDNVKIIATEQQIVFDLDGQKQFRGVIDRLDKDWDGFVINDYKTNKNLPTEDKDEYINQLTLYGLGVRQKYGKYFKTLKARLYFLHFDLVDEREITDERLDAVVKKYQEIVDEIENLKFYYNMWDNTIFKPKENKFCKYCEYFSICPLRTHMKYDDEVVWWELSEKTIKWLTDEYVQISKQIREFELQKEWIKEILIEYIQKKWFLKLFGNNTQISFSPTESLSIKDKEWVKWIFAEIGILDQILDLDRFKLQRAIKDKNFDLEKIKDFVELKKSWMLRGSEKGMIAENS